jgi:hypothetical protein
VSTCRHCGRPIRWVAVTSWDYDTGSERTSAIPVDAEPTERGNVFVQIIDGRLVGRVASKAVPRPPGVAHMPHFATCPTLTRQRGSDVVKPPKPPKPELDQPALF